MYGENFIHFVFLFFTFMDFCKWIFSTAVKLLVYAVLNKTELKNGFNVIILFHFGNLRFGNYVAFHLSHHL